MYQRVAAGYRRSQWQSCIFRSFHLVRPIRFPEYVLTSLGARACSRQVGVLLAAPRLAPRRNALQHGPHHDSFNLKRLVSFLFAKYCHDVFLVSVCCYCDFRCFIDNFLTCNIFDVFFYLLQGCLWRAESAGYSVPWLVSPRRWYLPYFAVTRFDQYSLFARRPCWSANSRVRECPPSNRNHICIC